MCEFCPIKSFGCHGWHCELNSGFLASTPARLPSGLFIIRCSTFRRLWTKELLSIDTENVWDWERERELLREMRYRERLEGRMLRVGTCVWEKGCNNFEKLFWKQPTTTSNWDMTGSAAQNEDILRNINRMAKAKKKVIKWKIDKGTEVEKKERELCYLCTKKVDRDEV